MLLLKIHNFDSFFFNLFVQCLFPGLWLTEVTADSYKVPEFPENGKV